MKTPFLCAALLLAIGSAQAEGLYRWVDKSGAVHYGDVPTEEAAGVEKKKFGADHELDNADLPYETRRAVERFPVTLYVASNCAEPCQQARDLLNKRGIPFTEKSLHTQKEFDDFKRQTGSDSVPTLTVGKRYLKGFQAEQWNGELSTAGYPKLAPYRPQVNTKPVVKKPAVENKPVVAP